MARQALYEDHENAGKRTIKDTINERDTGFGSVKSHGGTQTSLTVAWALNDQAKEDRICMIQIGKEQAFVNADQLMKFIRWV